MNGTAELPGFLPSLEARRDAGGEPIDLILRTRNRDCYDRHDNSTEEFIAANSYEYEIYFNSAF